MGRTASTPAAAALAALALAGCGGGGAGKSTAGSTAAPAKALPGRIVLTSPSFAPNGRIPSSLTCTGGSAPPPLRWSHLPSGTQALALTVEDPDAPGGTFVHWIVYDVPPATKGLSGSKPPPGALEALNSQGSTGWTPPCPPPGGGVHRYVFTLYALRERLKLGPNPDAAKANAAIAAAALDRGQLVGRFGR